MLLRLARAMSKTFSLTRGGIYMKVGIVGMGHVGKAMVRVFGPYAEVVTYDIAADNAYPESALEKCDFIAVCVGTPMSRTWWCASPLISPVCRAVAVAHENGRYWLTPLEASQAYSPPLPLRWQSRLHPWVGIVRQNPAGL